MSDWNVQTALRTLVQECRGEPLIGQQAVAAVLVNRLKDGRWGNCLSSVCLWRGQFSGWYVPRDPNFAYACALPDRHPLLLHFEPILNCALEGLDPTQSAKFYVNLSYADPKWKDDMEFCGKFGAHSFYKEK